MGRGIGLRGSICEIAASNRRYSFRVSLYAAITRSFDFVTFFLEPGSTVTLFIRLSHAIDLA